MRYKHSATRLWVRTQTTLTKKHIYIILPSLCYTRFVMYSMEMTMTANARGVRIFVRVLCRITQRRQRSASAAGTMCARVLCINIDIYYTDEIFRAPHLNPTSPLSICPVYCILEYIIHRSSHQTTASRQHKRTRARRLLTCVFAEHIVPSHPYPFCHEPSIHSSTKSWVYMLCGGGTVVGGKNNGIVTRHL